MSWKLHPAVPLQDPGIGGGAMVEKLIRRDTRLRTGQKVQLRVITYYDVLVDDYLDGEESITIDEIELDLGGKYRSDSQMADAARKGNVGDATDGDAHFTVDIPSDKYGQFEARFETKYEEERRRQGAPSYGAEYVDPGF